MVVAISYNNQVCSITETLHAKALLAARQFKKAEADLVQALIEIDQHRVFIQLGYSSLFQYATRALGLSEAVAYNAITVARKAREVPALCQQLHAGTLSLTQAKRIAPVLTVENAKSWIQKAETLPARSLEKAVVAQALAQGKPQWATPERTKYVSEKYLELRLGVSEKLMLDLRQAQHLASQSLGNAANLEDTLQIVVQFYLQHKYPMRRSQRVIAKKGISTVVIASKKVALQPVPNRSTQNTLPGRVHRTPIPASIEHAVRFRDRNQCQHRCADGSLCGEKRWVELHHLVPVSQGGPHSAENLITLCRAHHRYGHRGG